MSGSGSGATVTVEPVALSKGVAMKVKKIKKIVEKAEKKIAKLRPESKKKDKNKQGRP